MKKKSSTIILPKCLLPAHILSLEDSVPDNSSLSRFRTELTVNNGMDKILNAFNKQLEKHNLIVKTGVKVDASITETLCKPKGSIRYEIAEDRKEDEVPEEEKSKQIKSLVKLQIKISCKYKGDFEIPTSPLIVISNLIRPYYSSEPR